MEEKNTYLFRTEGEDAGSAGCLALGAQTASGPRRPWPTHTIKHRLSITAIMVRTVRFVSAVALFGVAALYLAYRSLLRANEEPVVLVGYPDERAIEDAFTSRSHNVPLYPPFRTRGRHIVDNNDLRVKLASVNWYGASDELFVVGGLDIRHRRDIAETIKALGFNSVRLPYSDQLVIENPPIPAALVKANEDLMGKTALEVYAAVVTALTEVGLAVIVNNHITAARWCCDANLCDGTWYNSYLGPLCKVRQTQEDWISHLERVMKPHINDPLVIGVDLRNEIRGIRDRYLWDEWVSAAEEAAERLHLMQPNWLMFVEGVSSANVISGARLRPVVLSTPNKVVYSAHIYGWSGWGALRPYWGRDYGSFAADMHDNWAWMIEEDIAPVWIGEFGAPEEPNSGDLNYWQHLMVYLRAKDVDWGYWALNPRKPHNNAPEGYGLLKDDWKSVRWDYRLWDMKKLLD